MAGKDSTEASCLLQSGALYHHRLGLVPASGSSHSDLIFAGFKKGAFSLYFGDEPIYHFDLEGRWQRAFIHSTHYLKGLDTAVHTIDRVREGVSLVLRRRALGAAEVEALDRRARDVALGLLGDLEAGRLRRQEPAEGKAAPLDDGDLRDFLVRIARWDTAAWNAHASRYRAAYGPLPFLPPDCQNAVVLQATNGTTGGVQFGTGPESDHSVRSPAEFEQHAQAIARLVGRRLIQSRIVFLVGSDVLRLARADLLDNLDIVRRRFMSPSATRDSDDRPDAETARVDSIYAMLDDFSPGRPDRETLRAARERGLLHVSLGVESGDCDLRSRFGKNWSDDDLRAAAADLRASGIKFSLLTLVGAGGSGSGKAHVAGTARLLSSLDLARGDTVFLLDENELGASPGAIQKDDQLTGTAWTQQQERLKQALAPLRERGVKVLPYSLEKQWT
jgi:hypothetical protein